MEKNGKTLLKNVRELDQTNCKSVIFYYYLQNKNVKYLSSIIKGYSSKYSTYFDIKNEDFDNITKIIFDFDHTLTIEHIGTTPIESPDKVTEELIKKVFGSKDNIDNLKFIFSKFKNRIYIASFGYKKTIELLLDKVGLNIPHDRIYGNEGYKGDKNKMLNMISEDKSTIFFVDDDGVNIQKAEKLDIKSFNVNKGKLSNEEYYDFWAKVYFFNQKLAGSEESDLEKIYNKEIFFFR